MLNLRSAVQRCVRRASIVGSCPLRHHTSRNNSNVIYVSRQTFADANVELVENASQHSGIKHLSKVQTTAVTDNKQLPDMANDPEAKETTSITATKSSSGIANDPEAEAIPSFSESSHPRDKKAQESKNLDFRRYHIFVRGFSVAIKRDMLQKFYSQFGKLIRCMTYKNEQGTSDAMVVFGSKKGMHRALKSQCHHINGEEVIAEIGTHKTQLNLRVQDLSPETTEESLRDFYSKFGNLTQCVVAKDPKTGKAKIGYVSFASHEELDRALDAQPHFIDGSQVFLRYSTDELNLIVKELPEGITEESLRTFFSQYGRLRRCELIKGKTGITHAFLSFSTLNEVNRAMEHRPHIIDRKLLKTDFPRRQGLYTIFVGSLPENATGVSLFKAFSPFGKIVHLEVRNDTGRNRRGGFGFVSYGTWQEADNALNASPHSVEGVTVDVKVAKEKQNAQQNIEYKRNKNSL